MNDKKYISWEEAVQWLRDQPDQQKLVRFCYYDDPVEQAAERFSTSDEWKAVLKLLKPGHGTDVLDLGAGRGISSYAFAKSGCRVTALEPDSSPLVGSRAIQELFAKTGLKVTIAESRGEQLPFSDNSFDIVYGRAVFHHAGNLKKFCAEARRVLRPGGVFLMTREHVLSRKKDLQAFLKSHPLHSLYGGENAYLLKEYREAIELSGLREVRVMGPYESAINYAPMTNEEFHEMIVRLHARFIGKRLGQLLVAQEAYKAFCCRWLTRTSNHPGRLYTFWAEKKS